MNGERRRIRLNLSLSIASPLQREAWEILRAVPSGQRTEAVCRAVCRVREQDALLEAVRAAVREELRSMEQLPKIERTEQPQTGGVNDNVLGFLRSLQNDE